MSKAPASSTFADMFDTRGSATDGSCAPPASQPINANGAGHECLKLKTGMERPPPAWRPVATLPTWVPPRNCARKKASPSIRERKKLYVSMSEIERGMEDNAKDGVANTKYDIGGPNDIKVAANTCGGVYAVRPGHRPAIGSDCVATVRQRPDRRHGRPDQRQRRLCRGQQL